MATLDEIHRQLVDLADQAEEHSPDPDHAAGDIVAAARRRSTTRVWVLSAAAVVVLVVVAVGVFAALAPGDADGTRVVTEPTSTLVDEQPDVSGPAPPGPSDVGLTVGAPIAVEGGWYVKESGGWVWMSNAERPEILTRLDPQTLEVVAEIDLGLPFADMATDGESVWTLHGDAGRVSRVDATTRAVVWTQAVGATGGGIAHGSGSLWVANSDARTVTRLDADTGEIETVIALGDRPFTIEELDGWVWVSASPDDDAVYRIDAADNSVMRVPGLDEVSAALDADHGSVWLIDRGDMVRIDPDTLAVLARVDVPGEAFAPAVGRRHVWASSVESCDQPDTCIVWLVRIDPAANTVADTMEVDAGGAAPWVTEVAVVFSDTDGRPVPVFVEGGT